MVKIIALITFLAGVFLIGASFLLAGQLNLFENVLMGGTGIILIMISAYSYSEDKKWKILIKDN